MKTFPWILKVRVNGKIVDTCLAHNRAHALFIANTICGHDVGVYLNPQKPLKSFSISILKNGGK